jgi:hypothetical protein
MNNKKDMKVFCQGESLASLTWELTAFEAKTNQQFGEV